MKSGSAEKLDYELVIIKMNNFTNDIVASKIKGGDFLTKNREKVSNSFKSRKGRRLVSDYIKFYNIPMFSWHSNCCYVRLTTSCMTNG